MNETECSPWLVELYNEQKAAKIEFIWLHYIPSRWQHNLKNRLKFKALFTETPALLDSCGHHLVSLYGKELFGRRSINSFHTGLEWNEGK